MLINLLSFSPGSLTIPAGHVCPQPGRLPGQRRDDQQRGRAAALPGGQGGAVISETLLTPLSLIYVIGTALCDREQVGEPGGQQRRREQRGQRGGGDRHQDHPRHQQAVVRVDM